MESIPSKTAPFSKSPSIGRRPMPSISKASRRLNEVVTLVSRRSRRCASPSSPAPAIGSSRPAGISRRPRAARNPTRTGESAASADFNYPRNLNKPIIAAVNGIACGGGFEIVLGTDIIVMEEHAKFALPEINVGVLADAGTIKLRRRIPYHVAVEFLLTGRWMDAAEAKHWGLANHVVPKGQGLAKAREIARQLADGPPLLFPAIKQLLRHTEMVPEHEAFELHDSLDAVQRVIRSEDLKEGTRAFTEKRKPRWTGR